MRRDSIIALVSKLVAIVHQLIDKQRPAIIENRSSSNGIAIGAGDCHEVAQRASISKVIEETTADKRPLVILLALVRHPVPQHVMKIRRGLVIDGSADEEVLVLLRRVV